MPGCEIIEYNIQVDHIHMVMIVPPRYAVSEVVAKKILIADDEPDIVKMLSMRLEAHGYEVIAAFDGLQAVREAYKERPDLILLDIKIPVGDGYKETGTLLGRRYKIIQRR